MMPQGSELAWPGLFYGTRIGPKQSHAMISKDRNHESIIWVITKF